MKSAIRNSWGSRRSHRGAMTNMRQVSTHGRDGCVLGCRREVLLRAQLGVSDLSPSTPLTALKVSSIHMQRGPSWANMGTKKALSKAYRYRGRVGLLGAGPPPGPPVFSCFRFPSLARSLEGAGPCTYREINNAPPDPPPRTHTPHGAQTRDRELVLRKVYR